MHNYIKNHIIEELNGAIDYWSKAVEYKKTLIGETFREMAETELDHANSLLEIFNKLESNNYYIEEELYTEILKAYSDGMYKIAKLKRLYKKED